FAPRRSGSRLAAVGRAIDLAAAFLAAGFAFGTGFALVAAMAFAGAAFARSFFGSAAFFRRAAFLGMSDLSQTTGRRRAPHPRASTRRPAIRSGGPAGRRHAGHRAPRALKGFGAPMGLLATCAI